MKCVLSATISEQCLCALTILRLFVASNINVKPTYSNKSFTILRNPVERLDINEIFLCHLNGSFTLEDMPLLMLLNPICTYKKRQKCFTIKGNRWKYVCCSLFIALMFSVNTNMQSTYSIFNSTNRDTFIRLFKMCAKNFYILIISLLILTKMVVCIQKYESFFYSSNSMNDISLAVYTS